MKVEVLKTVNLRARRKTKHEFNDRPQKPKLITRDTRALVTEALGEHHSFERSAHVDLHMHQVSCAIRLDR